MKRIVCIGNRYIFEDAAGPKVFDRLLQHPLPDDIEVIDGGLGGLDLLRFVEGAERVVFVDGVTGFSRSDTGEYSLGGQMVILEAADVTAAAGSRYEHSAGLAYLLRILPVVCEGVVPYTLLVGIEGQPDERLVDEVATLAVQIALGDDPRISKDGLQDNTSSGGAG